MKFFPKDKAALNGRVFRSGLYSAAITAAVLVLAGLVNLLVRALPTKYTTFDLSEAGLYTLSDSSAQVAQGLTQPGAVACSFSNASSRLPAIPMCQPC